MVRTGRRQFDKYRKYREKCLFLLVSFFILCYCFPAQVRAQETCEEVLLSVKVQPVGTSEISSLICGEKVLLSFQEVFDFLQIKNEVSADFSEIRGFFIDPENHYVVDVDQNEIIYKGEHFPLEHADIVKTRTNLFLNVETFGRIFGLEGSFDYRRLSVVMDTEMELPSVKAARQKMLRENLAKLSNDFIADSSIVRERPFFRFGVFDWNLSSHQSTLRPEYHRFSGQLGGLVAGGELTGRLNYSTQRAFRFRDQFLQWRYVNNKSKLLQQLTAGKFWTNSIASIYDPVSGIQITNEPAIPQELYGTYTISDYTNPEWVVELYVNNVLVAYTRADAAGFFSFDVPLMYGSTEVSFKYYGPWGEEETSKQVFTIPYSFTPAGTFRYNFSSGIIENEHKDLYASFEGNYGISRNFTLGSGLEFLSSMKATPLVPYASASARLPLNVLISGKYMYDIGFTGNLSLTTGSGLGLNLEYKNYQEDQEVVQNGYLEERLAQVFFPLRSKIFTGISRFSFQQNFLKFGNFSTGLWQLSGRSFGQSLSLTTEAFWSSFGKTRIYSEISTAIRFPGEVVLTPQLEFDLVGQRLTSFRARARKRFFKDAFIFSAYTHNLRTNSFQVNIGFSLNLGFSRLGMNSVFNNKYVDLSESLSGSAIIDPVQEYVEFDSRSSVGFGSIRFLPFLDVNNNGKKDDLEPPVENIEVFSPGGGQKEVKQNGIFFYHLEPYQDYYFELGLEKLENISWRVRNESLMVAVNPNEMKTIAVPVKVVGEVAGFVYHKGSGIGGIKINIYDQEENLVKSLLTQSDGFFSYFGLESGNFVARADSSQLEKLRMKVDRDFRFSIKNAVEGDYVDHLEFFLSDQAEQKGDVVSATPNLQDLLPGKEPGRTVSSGGVLKHPAEEKSSGNQPGRIKTGSGKEAGAEEGIRPVAQEIEDTPAADLSVENQVSGADLKVQDLSGPAGETKVQDLVFKVQILASVSKIPVSDAVFKGLQGVQEHRHNGLYKYTWSSSRSFGEANQVKNMLRSNGFEDAFVVPFHDGKRLNAWQVEGSVRLDSPGGAGIGGIPVNIFDSSGKIVSRALTELDGSFTVPGLEPGTYTARADEKRLHESAMQLARDTLQFRVREDSGISTSKIEFLVEVPEQAIPDKNSPPGEKGLIFRVQVLAAVPKLAVTHSLLRGLEDVKRYRHQGLYKYTKGSSNSLQEIGRIKRQLRKKGFLDAFIVPFYNGRRINIQEMTGRVLLDLEEQREGLEGIRINIFNDRDQKLTTLVSEKEGYMSFLGLVPGHYLARPDVRQLEKLGLVTNQDHVAFEIEQNKEGEISHPVQFVLRKKKVPGQKLVKKEGKRIYKVQIAASNVPLGPNHPSLKAYENVEMYEHAGMYKYTIGKSSSRKDISRILEEEIQTPTKAFIVVFEEGLRVFP